MSISEDLVRIAAQEERLQFTNFDEQTAWELGSAIHQVGTARKLKIVVDVRRSGHPLFYAALPGTTPDNAEWIRRKSNLTLRFHRSSYAIALEMEEKKSTIHERYGLPIADYAGHGGCFPIRVHGAGFIGAVTVSGLPMRADHELAVEGFCALLGCDYREVCLQVS